MNIYDRMMAIGTKMTEMDASTYQGAFIGKISYMAEKEQAGHPLRIRSRKGECIYVYSSDSWLCRW